MKCEYCGKEHDGSYGSGRFCSSLCRSRFSNGKPRTGRRRKEPWVCDICGAKLLSRGKLYEHRHKEHAIQRVWNKGKTKKTDKRLLKASQTLKASIREGRTVIWCKGKTLPAETKKKISASMKKAHSDGRAHNIGESRWNNEPSYPEKWFMRVIANEFDDKNYVREYPFHRFSLDFAWVEKKKCIEIDGEQHQRFDDYKERDARKDKELIKHGWQFLRLVWKDVYANPKKFIAIANDFIGK